MRPVNVRDRFSYGLLLLLLPVLLNAQSFHLARLKYGGGGDWYADPSSLPNLIEFIQEETSIRLGDQEARVELGDAELFNYPFLYMTGHGNVRFTDAEVRALRDYLASGGFLHTDDNYGLDESFRREMKRVFPSKEWVELPRDHALFQRPFGFPDGLPKIHEHDGKPPQALALFHEGRICVLYTYETDLGDGWEDLEVHNDGPAKHRQALEMGANIVYYALAN